jgi:outer membrane biogenesis lipoprotein LolB
LPAYWDNSVSTLLLLLAMVATVALFACSLLLMITAAVCYVPRESNFNAEQKDVDTELSQYAGKSCV